MAETKDLTQRVRIEKRRLSKRRPEVVLFTTIDGFSSERFVANGVPFEYMYKADHMRSHLLDLLEAHTITDSEVLFVVGVGNEMVRIYKSEPSARATLDMFSGELEKEPIVT